MEGWTRAAAPSHQVEPVEVTSWMRPWRDVSHHKEAPEEDPGHTGRAMSLS